MNRTQNAVRSSIWGYINMCISVLLPFAVRTIIIKTLGDEYVGLNSLFMSILSVLSLVELGFSSAIVFNMYKPVSEGDDKTICELLNYYRKIYHIVGIVVIGVGLTFVPFLDKLVSGEYPKDINLYIIYGIYLFNTVITYFLFGYRTSLFYAHQRNDLYSKILSVSYTSQYLIQIIVLLLFKNYYWYIAVHAILIIPQCIAVYFVSKKIFPTLIPKGKPDVSIRHDIKIKVLSLLGHKIGATIMVSIDSIIISSFLGLVILGKYSNYYYLVSSVIAFTNIITQSTLPAIGNKLLGDDYNEKYTALKNLTFIWNWIVGWCAICFMCLFQPFVYLWVGSTRMFDITFVGIMVCYYYAWQFRVMGLNFKDAAGLWKNDWLKPYIGMILNFVFSILMVKYTGNVLGVLIPTICVMLFIYYPWETNVIFKNIFHKKPTEYIFRGLIYAGITIITGAATYILCSFMPENGYLWFLIKVVICCVVPNIIFIAVSFHTPEFRYFLNIFKKYSKRILSRNA